MLIRMKDFAKGAFGLKDAEALKSKVEEALQIDNTVIVDFEGIERYSIFFFSNSLAIYAKTYGKAWYDKTINVINLTEFGNKIYSRFYEITVEHPKKYNTKQIACIKDMFGDLSEPYFGCCNINQVI